MWCPGYGAGTIANRAVTPRLSMIAALDTDGRVFFSLGHANTDSDAMMTFMQYLIRYLDLDDPPWRDSTVVLLDNTAWHSSEEMRGYLRKMQVPTMFSGPYSYGAAPIEMMFGALKKGELNPTRLPMGKK